MQVVFVGGASGVGASCVAAEIAGNWILIDAGVRVDRKSDPLPDLALLEDKHIQAIFVTHAHADHIGALPLVHQAFPTAPIFCSRATGLLMEVMLADALKIMNRRAVEEMEIPLYPSELLSSMLQQVRPLPVGETLTLSQVPGVSIHSSRAGHIAGAVSFSFSGSDGTLVVSGDISSTPQRTVLGALPPPVERCDLLILESTYGARLHPNRQGEEQRLAQAVADGIARGGHVLIPCFGLGRGQELLLILQAAQEKGQIPDFPIYVDGLVRRVCSTYQLLPEALPPVLQRQLRKGYQPFSGRNVTFVKDERQRERILAGPPACIVSSSGMLTGGPSVWYAQRLAGQEQASILITGYQDEESPGKRLLDLAEQKDSVLDLNGNSVAVRCHIAKYSLSAHADGGELAAYAASLKPRQIALVHGDEEARLALRRLLIGAEVLLPENGTSIVPAHQKKRTGTQVPGLPALPTGIGKGRTLEVTDLEELWQTVTQLPALRIVTARELATIWYGESSEATTSVVLDVLNRENEQRYFIRQQALEEAYRVRGSNVEEPTGFLSDFVGKILLVEVSPGSSKPVFCQSIEPGARIRVLHPRGVDFSRPRYPYSAIIELIGEASPEMPGEQAGMPAILQELIKTSRSIRRRLSAQLLAEQCQPEATYTLGDLCQMAGISANKLEDRLALAKVLYKHPLLFQQQQTLMEGEGLVLYSLTPDWQEVLAEPEDRPRPDQNWLQTIITQHLGEASDLYKRSIDPDTGEITLAFHFPERAAQIYASQIAAIGEESGVAINIAAQPHQGELVRLARQLLPSGLQELAFPSLYHESQRLQIKCQGEAPEQDVDAARETFYARTGWQLEIAIQAASKKTTVFSDHTNLSSQRRADQNTALQAAQRLLRNQPGYVKVGAEAGRQILHARFYFPEIARQRYTAVFQEIEAETGWQVQVQDGIHQEALAEMARSVLPQGLQALNTPSIYLQQQTVLIQCKGTSTQEEIQQAQQHFEAETGWQLTITIPGQRGEGETSPRMAQAEAMAHVSAAFRSVPELYRIGTDTRLKIIWLHFHFPARAGEEYAELLNRLEEETGWRLSLHPHVHQKALIERVQRLLPDDVSLVGKKAIYEETQTLHVRYSGKLEHSIQQHILYSFTKATGWQLILNREDEEKGP